ncbi:MAG TPA: bifunctional phosphoribosylaminoimidazolecarboxamide formyltransferase/IMP cyclohydrolase PurH, partial [Flavobacteriaceae bacterium]|nr:bifunctional phosphoribosylaminoimidazolecarboxamide formyltransferase/IMP cyclohydrolase PurH [Flavobacteriaceae bacterium]
MNDRIPAKSALISVFHKEGLAPIVKKLDELGVTIYSTGGTEKFIKELGIDVVPVEDITSYPSILGGRVKTLHPKVFGGILNRRGNESDRSEMDEFEIPQIDLVIVDLYPFEKTVASGASEEEIVEKIDIGGISLIRAAAKNFKDVLCVASMEDYDEFLTLLSAENG